jgi:hypothetical protein
VATVPVAATSSVSSIVRKKYEMCKNFREKGSCKYGDRCLFAHGDHELTRRGSPNGEEPKKEEKKPEDIKEQESTKNGDTALTLTKTTVQAADTTLSI